VTTWVSHGRSRLLAGAPAGNPPSAPSNVTSITKDAGATLSFLAPASIGSGAITSYTATPYIAGVAQSPTTTAVGSAGSIAGSNGSTYVQVPCNGLTNGTAYTFSVHASNASGAGPESAQSGANTPLSGLVFGDDFNGPASGPIDPEWYVYDRCGYIAQSEVEWYKPSNCILDGASNLQLIASQPGHTGPSYPSDGNTVRAQTWLSGACQSNTRTYTPVSGNTMTFETSTKTCANIGVMWPGLFWLEGQDFKDPWKTDPDQSAWNLTGKAEIDIQEWNPQAGASNTNYLNNLNSGSGWDSFVVSTATDFSLAFHTFQCKWKPGVSIHWLRDGSETRTAVTTNVPTSGCAFFLLLYLQILAGSASSPQTCYIDYIHVYDQNLG
jgi:hypothetical protein